MITLNISKYKEVGAKIYTDRDNGVNARKELDLDKNELSDDIKIQLPIDTWGINPSFFGGLFETSIKNMKHDFFNTYSFEYTNGSPINESLNKDIQNNFEYVLNSLE